MAKKLPELSVFFPFWNEDENIEAVVEAALKVVPQYAEKWEIIMVDDGSKDETAKIGATLSSKHKNVRLVTNHLNRGYGASLREGFMNSQYEYIVFTDGDRQFDFSQVSKFVDKIHTVDMVIGYRKKRQDHFIRHIFMYMLKVWDFILFGIYFKDIDCGFKMLRRRVVDGVMPLRSEGAMISTEFLAKAKNKGFTIAQVEVNHYPRKFGHETGGNLYVVIRAILESLILWWDIRNGRI